MRHRRRQVCVVISILVFCAGRDALAATRHWTGNGIDTLWTTAANWAEGVPVANDDLVFPAGAPFTTNSNNFPAGTSFNSITLGGGYILQQNSITLREGITSTGVINIIDFPIILGGGLPVGVVHTVSTTGQLLLNGVISGCSSIAVCSIRKEGPGTLEFYAANTFGAPTTVAEGLLAAFHNLALGDSSSTTVLAGASLFLYGVTIAEPLVLNGDPSSGAVALYSDGNANAVTGNVTLASNAIIHTTASLELSGAISGAGGLIKAGNAFLTLSGATANSYTGTTVVTGGTLLLSKPTSVKAVAGSLVIGDNGINAGIEVVALTASSQIGDGSPVTITSSGELNLNGFSQVIGPLSMTAGHVTTGAVGLLTLGGDLTATSTLTGLPIIDGRLSLGSSNRTFNIVDGNSPIDLQINAIMSGSPGVGFTKTGTGTLNLVGANTYSGETVIAQGLMGVFNATALGTISAGTTVRFGSTLLVSASIGAEPLTLNGVGAGNVGALKASGGLVDSWGGPITLASSSTISAFSGFPFSITGSISGPGSFAAGGVASPGTVALLAANSYEGATAVISGTLRLSAFDTIPDTSNVAINAAATLEHLFSETVGSLAGAGTLELGAGTFTVGGTNLSTQFSGTISGLNGITKMGTGTFTLSGANTNTGMTRVIQGTLIVDGAQPASPVVVNAAGTLGGIGTTGAVTVTGGTVSPGASPGMLTAAGNVTLDTSTDFVAELNGPTVASGYDQLRVTGSVTLGSATLVTTLSAAVVGGETFVVIDNDGSDPVVGTFEALPEGATLPFGGTLLRISYVGGDGNDVTLTTAALSTYLAEGATSDFFDMQIALMNPNPAAADATLRFLKSDGSSVVSTVTVPALGRRTVNPKTIAGLEVAEFSTVIEANRRVVVDRTMTWDANGYGSHAETSVTAPALTWYLAEGATHSGFNVFYLLQNPNPFDAAVQVTFLLPSPAPPVVRNYAVAANSRFNIWVDQIPELADTDVSAVVTLTNDAPIIVERAMYLDSGGRLFGAGHESAGVTAPATSWFLAEGATGPFFDLFALIANPTGTDATIEATYLLPSGATIVKNYVAGANSRFNIWVDLEGPELADTAVSITIASTNGVPVIVERAMWWPGSSATWHEAHNSPGSTATGTVWALAEGEVSTDTRAVETYILIANTSAFAGAANVTLIFEDGATAVKTVPLAANSRSNVSVALDFPEAVNRRFGALIESVGGPPAQIVVERAMYSNALGVVWAAGSNALATRLLP